MRVDAVIKAANFWTPLVAGALCLGSASLAIADGAAAKQGKGSANPPPTNTTNKTSASAPYSGSIEEIVVTARRREENMQATPVAISVFTESDLVDRDVRRLDKITASVPTLVFDSAIGSSQSARVHLRGVGNGDPISTRDPSVGIYVDGVYLPRSQGSLLTVSDLQQVEVLRGPQGTLFGKNTIGGAVNITSRKPDTSEFGGSGQVRIGNYRRFDSRLVVNTPLVAEKAAARFSVATGTRAPFVENRTSANDLQDDKLLGGRAQFLWIPNDSSEFNLSLDRSREHRVQLAGKCVVSNRRPIFDGVNGTELPDGPDTNGNGILETAASAASFAAVNGVPLNQQLAILGSLTTDQTQNNYLNTCDEDRLHSARSVANDASQKDFLDTYGLGATYQYSFTDDLSIKSITSRRRNINVLRLDQDYSSLEFAQPGLDTGDNVQDFYSQEFQLNGTALDQRLKYVVGLFGFREAINGTSYVSLSARSSFIGAGALDYRLDPTDQNSAVIPFAGAVQLDPTIVTTFNATAATFGTPGVTVVVPGALVATPGAITSSLTKVNNQGFAGYTQGTYALTDRLSATLGARLTSERKRVRIEDRAVTGGFVGGAVRRPGELDFGFERSARFSDVSPLANLAFQATDDVLLYSTYSKGFKSGGYNGRASDPVLTNKIDDEELISYEVGFKSILLNNKLRLNGAGYYSLYKDIQLTIPRGINNQAAIQVVNAGKAEIKGAELEVLAQLLPNLALTASGGVINAHYLKFDDASDAFAEDRRLVATPNYTGNIALDFTQPVGSLGSLHFFSSWAYRGKQGSDVVDSREARVGKSGELDGSITLELADGQTEIALFGNNLLNREYVFNAVNLSDSLGIAYRFYNDPRTFGIEVRRRF